MFCFRSIEVLINASLDTSTHVSKLLMIQKLKKYSMPRMYCEIIRSCFITLCHVKDVNYRVWGAFTLYKVPQILKQLSMHNSHGKGSFDEKSTDEDISKAFDMLLECTPILDLLDTTFACNSIECILVELKKLNLVSESTVLRLVEKRQGEISKLEKFHIPSTTPSLDKYVASMEPPLTGLISSLKSIDQIKKEFLDVLCTLAVDNRAFLLYSVASVKGKHRTIINGLMKCNDSFKEISGDAAKNKQIFTFRSNVFDISFIMLFSIMQKSGIEKFQTDSGSDFFFEKWVRDGMIYSTTKLKSPLSVVKMSDPLKVDELITYFNDNSNLQQPPPISCKLGEICNNIPAMLYNILIAWENDTIQPKSVKNILENMRQKMCCFSVVAACWLCAYMKVLRHDELEKPKAMVQQLMMMPSDENVMKQETFSERFSLTQEIIMKLFDTRSYSKKPINNLFNDQWNEIITKRWLPYDIAINLEELLKSCGPFWLMKNIVDQIMGAKFIKDMDNAMDIAFSVMHLNIEACTETLLRDILISMLYKNQ
jgi:mediator of RNA polymerase II transcription subunit 24